MGIGPREAQLPNGPPLRLRLGLGDTFVCHQPPYASSSSSRQCPLALHIMACMAASFVRAFAFQAVSPASVRRKCRGLCMARSRRRTRPAAAPPPTMQLVRLTRMRPEAVSCTETHMPASSRPATAQLIYPTLAPRPRRCQGQPTSRATAAVPHHATRLARRSWRHRTNRERSS